MTRLAHLLAVSLLAATLAHANAAAPQPANSEEVRPPTTRPIDDQQKRIDGLIAQLAADDFALRERASRELEKIGKAALPALKEAADSDDPSIQTHASVLVKKLEGKRRFDTGMSNMLEGELALGDLANFKGRVAWDADFNVAGLNAARLALGNFGNARSVSVKDGDRQVILGRDHTGLVTVDIFNADKKGQHFKAKSEEELKEQHPEAFKLYDKYRKLLDRQPFARFQVNRNFDILGDDRTFRMIDGNRVVEIEQHGGDDGRVKVTLRDADANRIMQTFEANSPDELRKAHPDIGKLYDRFAHLMERDVPVLRNIPHMNRLFVNPKAEIRLHGPEQHENLRTRLEAALKEAGVSNDQRKQILDRADEALRERPNDDDDDQIIIEADSDGVRQVP